MAFPLLARLTVSVTPLVSTALGRPQNRLQRACERLMAHLPSAAPALVLTTCGGFFHFPWPPHFEWSDNLEPSAQDRRALERAAEHHLWQLLTPEMVAHLSSVTHFLSLGADSETCSPTGYPYRCELVAVVNLRTRRVHWTGKYYPTDPGQMRRLYRCPEPESHFISLRRCRTMVLGCHDLNLFSPRGMAVASPDGVRATWRAAFLAAAREFAPTLVLHHPHTTHSPRVWRQAIHQLQRELPTVRHFISGLNTHGASCRADVPLIQQATRLGSGVLEL